MSNQWSIDTLTKVVALAQSNSSGADRVMLLENAGTPLLGEATRRYLDGKPRLDITGWSWGQIVNAAGGVVDGSRSYTPLTVVRLADAASASLASLAHSRNNRLSVRISHYRGGGDIVVTHTQPMFEFEISEAQIISQYFLTGSDAELKEILVFSYRGIRIRSAPQQSTGARGAVREAQINVESGI